jgi:SAM-dependent methyltransferase
VRTVSDAANEAQRRQWNADVRVSAWRKREPVTAAVTETLLAQAGLQGGESVLDIGCGGGRTTIAAAGRVGPAGDAAGTDISAPLITLARDRAGAAGVPNVRFMVADVQADELGGPFDVAISQFGVMFFDESVTAFANIRAAVRPGGRLVFACWQPLADNPWFVGAAVQPFYPPGPAAGPGKNPVGPFTLAEPDYTAGVLAAAGWSGVERTRCRTTVTVEYETLAEADDYLRFLGVPEERLTEARAACDQQLAPLRRADGRYDAPLAFQIFAARN